MHNISFNIPNLPDGEEFTEVRASWAAGGQVPSSTSPYHFKVLGNYAHTKYNTPHHNLGRTGPLVQFTFLTEQSCGMINCQAAETSVDEALEGWLREVLENGTGFHPALGIIWAEPSTGRRARASCRHTCRTCPACLSLGELVANEDVAIKPGHPHLNCGNKVYIEGIGTRTVKDRGGPAETQVDHYIGVSGCNAYGAAYGVRKTLKLFE